MQKKEIIQTVWELAEPIAKNAGVSLWDVQYVKEGSSYFLRIIIDKEDGDVSINECEEVSRGIDPILDEVDPIEDSYYLEVWSAGLQRQLTRDFHFEKNMGKTVIIGLFRELNGEKEPVMTLTGYDGKNITATDQHGESHTFALSSLRFVKQNDDIDFGGK